MPTTYYRVHGGKVTFAEYWRLANNPLEFAIAAVFKLFGGLPLDSSIPRVEALPFVEWDDLPRDARKRMQGPIDLLEDAGYRYAFSYRAPLLEHTRVGVASALLRTDGRAFALVVYAKEPNMSKVGVSCVSRFADGGFGVTTEQKKQLKEDPKNRTRRHPGASADAIAERHTEHLADLADDGLKPQKLDQDAGLPAAVLQGEQELVDFHAERGVFVPLTRAEIRAKREQRADDEG
jgi:hypothetical protein